MIKIRFSLEANHVSFAKIIYSSYESVVTDLFSADLWCIDLLTIYRIIIHTSIINSSFF